MKQKMNWLSLSLIAFALPVMGQAQDWATMEQPQTDATQMDKRQNATERSIQSWPENVKLEAQKLIDKYGPPDEESDRLLLWKNKGQWSQVTLYREAASDYFPTAHEDNIVNTIRYRVPQDKEGELIVFNSALAADRKMGTLSAHSDSEETNTLALNLADEIVRGVRDVSSARDFMRETLSKSEAGKSSPYTDHLMFPVTEPQGN